ncbi:nuclear transport factor 2 family protein [Phreatobacter stygius]|uniref:Nuclear transport factor 2 family protein n=1 Tax=Phreatobacter stygius TaxID=1940610 RepID=A0A4D7B6D7_9HYPH|nr:nuclear transport factor 2 family protein [Phreatobacter stygius]QCI66533.1 nuclear transport factor 2 family protein [Phreatobacter stygius]
MDHRYDEIVHAMQLYFDGLYHSDTTRLAKVFHDQARYVCATGGEFTHFGMADYWPIVDRRPSPASRNERRSDRIVSIEFAGPVTAFVRAECAIGPKLFTDLLTFIHRDGRWQIIAKVFHFDLRPQVEADAPRGDPPCPM